MRTNKRESTAIRPIKITPGVIENADGSCMIEIGKTRVICTASIENRVPFWLENSGKGWIRAEYGCYQDQQIRECRESQNLVSKQDAPKKSKGSLVEA